MRATTGRTGDVSRPRGGDSPRDLGVALGAASALANVENDLAGRATLVEHLERVGRLLERKALADDRRDDAGVDHRVDRSADLTIELRLAHRVGAPARS